MGVYLLVKLLVGPILDLARDRGLIRPLDLASHGLPRVSLTRLVRQGRLARIGRGLYALADRAVSEHSTRRYGLCGSPRSP